MKYVGKSATGGSVYAVNKAKATAEFFGNARGRQMEQGAGQFGVRARYLGEDVGPVGYAWVEMEGDKEKIEALMDKLGNKVERWWWN